MTIIYRNDGNGVFTDIHASLLGLADGALAWGDYDNEGRLDLLVAGVNYYNLGTAFCQVWRNDTLRSDTSPSNAPGAL